MLKIIMNEIDLSRKFNLNIAYDSLEKETSISGHNLDTGERFQGEAVINKDDSERLVVKLFISFNECPVLLVRGSNIETALWNAYKMRDNALYLGEDSAAITKYLNR